jgi:hypothetical protein
MYFRLNPECYFIRGKKRGAIFDLIDAKIFALNQQETEILTSSEKNIPIPVDENFLKVLKGLRLGNFYHSETAAAHPAAELAGHPRRRRIKMETGS